MDERYGQYVETTYDAAGASYVDLIGGDTLMHVGAVYAIGQTPSGPMWQTEVFTTFCSAFKEKGFPLPDLPVIFGVHDPREGCAKLIAFAEETLRLSLEVLIGSEAR